jgi:hypothetical protein
LDQARLSCVVELAAVFLCSFSLRAYGVALVSSKVSSLFLVVAVALDMDCEAFSQLISYGMARMYVLYRRVQISFSGTAFPLIVGAESMDEWVWIGCECR